MLICEALFLLLTNTHGDRKASNSRTYGFVAAAITDLVLHGRVDFSYEYDPRVRTIDPTLVGIPALDHVLVGLDMTRDRRLSFVIADLALDPEKIIAAQLAEQGLIDVKDHSFLWVSRAKYPERNPAPELQLRQHLHTVLHGGTPAIPDVALLTIIRGANAIGTALGAETADMTRRQVKARIEALEVPYDDRDDITRRVGPALQHALAVMYATIAAAMSITTYPYDSPAERIRRTWPLWGRF